MDKEPVGRGTNMQGGALEATIVIPWRDNGCEYRRRNLEAVRSMVEAWGFPVVLGEHDGPGLNISAMRNAGVAKAVTDVVILLDADFYPQRHVLTAGAKAAMRDGKVHHLAKRLIYLDEIGTQGLLKTGEFRRGRVISRSKSAPGGYTAFTREAWETVGGYDEAYVGWGYEDRDFNRRAAATVGLAPGVGECYHLWHPPAARGKLTAANKARYYAAPVAAPLTVNGSLPDVVYRVRSGDSNEELRFSLRSLVNFPHRNVWIVGHKPAWVTNVRHIPGNKHGKQKWANGWNNIELACQHGDISDPFILVDDDMFFLKPTTEIPNLHRDKLRDQIARTPSGSWKTTLQNALTWLESQGINDPDSYELHIPYVVHKAQMLEVLTKARNWSWPANPQWRTVESNYWRRGGTQGPDVKVRSSKMPDVDNLLSTTDTTFKHARSELERLFPRKCVYES